MADTTTDEVGRASPVARRNEPIGPKTTVTLSCTGTDPMPKGYDKITINDTF